MAGQPPDGPWQSASPNGQPGPEQVRIPWQPPQAQHQPLPAQHQPPYDQGQPFGPEQGQSYGHEQGQSYGHEQAYGQGRPYPQQQPYPQAGPGYGEALGDQHTQVFGAGAPQQPQAGWPPPPPGNPAFVARQRHVSRQKGFVGSLFDFSFNSYVTPKVIKGLYRLAALWTIVVALMLLAIVIHFGGFKFTTLLVYLPPIVLFVLLSLGSVRVFLETFMALHRMNENLQALRDRDEAR
ncbi:MAG TPA: DUF4282 domain-containing protein [Trebonia sp.]|nr:DUF4282 domain-containing protein [Trebonia sp.]